jgi:Amt family ammonium transporter
MEGPNSFSTLTPAQATDAVWVLVSAGFIFFMQTGFVLIEFGAVRRKNSQAMLLKNLINTAVAILAFWLIGYGFGFGDVSQFIGSND